MKQLNHPFLIKYIEEFEYKVKNKLCIVTKFVRGGNLQKIIKEKAFSEDEALKIFVMILLGVDFLHSKKIHHRDLKPENIFIEKLDNGMLIPIIGDFGISKMDLESIKRTLTSTSAFQTSPQYQAPEVINEKWPTAKVDIWASGIVLYEMLT